MSAAKPQSATKRWTSAPRQGMARPPMTGSCVIDASLMTNSRTSSAALWSVHKPFYMMKGPYLIPKNIGKHQASCLQPFQQFHPGLASPDQHCGKPCRLDYLDPPNTHKPVVCCDGPVKVRQMFTDAQQSIEDQRNGICMSSTHWSGIMSWDS